MISHGRLDRDLCGRMAKAYLAGWSRPTQLDGRVLA